MISCDFCPDRAYHVYVAQGIVWDGCPSTVAFCRWHLVRYYLGLHYVAAA